MSSYRSLLILFLLALLVRVVAVLPQSQPSYMDAAYYYDIALNLAHGQGLTEPFLWNYLDNPAGLPHPSHLYWMPLPTLVAWLGLMLFGQTYRAAQLPFAILSALLPLVSYWVALQTTGSRRHAWLAGLLTVFSGFYVLYWSHTDNFTPFALAGSLSLVAAWRASQARRESEMLGWALGAGILVGLAHLSRADGPLLLVAIAVANIKCQISNDKSQNQNHKSQISNGRPPISNLQSLISNFQSLVSNLRFDIWHLTFVILGYTLVMLPWFARDWAVAGSPLPATGAQSIWLTTYDDLFSYGRELSPQTYLAWGWSNILRSKLDALWLNTQTLVAVLSMVFLAPLLLVGAWRLRRHPLYQLAAWYGALLFLAMTFVFTFPGQRGGLLHSGGALLPFIFTAALVGLDATVEWAAARRRRWNARLAIQMFGTGLVGMAILVSGFLFYRGVLARARQPEAVAPYSALAEWLAGRGEANALVMVGDPPGYWYYGGGPSIVVPNEPFETTLAVADRYGAQYLVLDANRPAPLAALYEGTATHPRLSLAVSLPGNLHVYRIQPAEVSP
jgi:4-amino-4-deoxy-L-arabinose transferase-like glycosyltransferase